MQPHAHQDIRQARDRAQHESHAARIHEPSGRWPCALTQSAKQGIHCKSEQGPAERKPLLDISPSRDTGDDLAPEHTTCPKVRRPEGGHSQK